MTATRNPSQAELHFSRDAWLMLFLVIALLVYCLATLSYRLSLPTDGWAVIEGEGQGFLYIKNLVGIPSDLQPGDRVIAVEGYAADYLALSPLLKDTWRKGAILDYTVLRDGQEIKLPVRLGNWSLRIWLAELSELSNLVGLLPILFLLALGAFVFLRRPGNPAAGAFMLLMALMTADDLMNTLPSGFSEWVDPLANIVVTKFGNYIIMGALYPFALVRFALVFPHPKPILQRMPWLAYAFGTTGFALMVFIPDSPLGWFWFLLSIFLSVFIIIHNAFTMRDTVSQAQILWGLGGLIFGFGTIALMLLAGTFGLVEVTSTAFDPILNISMVVMGTMLAVAITRYRLFDIQVIIRRTLVYSTLTTCLALIYMGGVAVLQTLLGGLTGERQPEIVTVISTLAIAALFSPLRRRIQDFIDRRFYRKKYDAEHAMSKFAATARSETDLAVLSGQLVTVVQETVQPDQVSLWLLNGLSGERQPEIVHES